MCVLRQATIGSPAASASATTVLYVSARLGITKASAPA
jgi:hypothetical protein